jgi:hypothetical protein
MGPGGFGPGGFHGPGSSWALQALWALQAPWAGVHTRLFVAIRDGSGARLYGRLGRN